MLLRELVALAERLGAEGVLRPPLYRSAPVRYLVDLSVDGSLLVAELQDLADPTEPKQKRGRMLGIPTVQRSSGIKPILLADKAAYTFGAMAADDDKAATRATKAHEAYMVLLSTCALETGSSAVHVVDGFLRSDPLSRLSLPEDFDNSATITFRVDGAFVVDQPAVQRFWADHNEPSEESGLMQCIVCGENRRATKRLDLKVKRVPGGQKAGTSLISANSNAFESYGLEASLIAPTCSECGRSFTQALNWLLADDVHSVRMAGSAFVFWTRKKTEIKFFSTVVNPDEDQVRRLLDRVQKSGLRPTLSPEDANAFFGITLSGSGGRAVIRDWIETSVVEVERNVARWFDRQAMVDADGDSPPLGLWALAGATVRQLPDISNSTMRSLFRAALAGIPLPHRLLYEAVRRNRAEQFVTRPRAALIKLVLAGNGDIEEGTMTHLQRDNASAAYQCGRLMAVLERAQEQAIPGIKAKLTNRYFGAASSAPATVFPQLLRGVQTHLPKLARDKPGAYTGIQKDLGEIMGEIDDFPAVLNLKDQGRFSLGYYHQRSARYTRKDDEAMEDAK